MDIKILAGPLRLSEAATEAEVKARIENLFLLAEKAPKEGEEVIRSSELKGLRDRVEAVHAAERKRVVQGAIDAIKITKASEPEWNKRFDEDPKGTELLLASIVSKIDPKKEIGSSNGGPETTESATVQVLRLIEETKTSLKMNEFEARRHVEQNNPGLYVRMRAENTRVVRAEAPEDEEGGEK